MGEGGAILVVVLGGLLGARHTLEPDHLAAVSTMTAHGTSRTDVLRISAAWGTGHATMITITGILLMVVRWAIPPWLESHAELLAAFALIAVGIWTLVGVRRNRLHAHPHIHGTHPAHTHFHLHRHGSGHDVHPLPEGWLRRPLTAYVVGTLHGLAGSGAAVALAVLAASSPATATVYLVSFGLGTLAGMVVVGMLAMWPVIRVSSRAPRIRQLVQGLTGIASVIVGLLLVVGVL